MLRSKSTCVSRGRRTNASDHQVLTFVAVRYGAPNSPGSTES